MSSLGSVIAHEMGHAIRPVWSFPVDLSESDNASVIRFEDCIIGDFEHSGVNENRALITLSENWADAIGVRTLLRYTRARSRKETRDGLLLWMQTWCAAGDPHYDPLNTDPHSTPFMRVNGTISGLDTFFHVYNCNPNITQFC